MHFCFRINWQLFSTDTLHNEWHEWISVIIKRAWSSPLLSETERGNLRTMGSSGLQDGWKWRKANGGRKVGRKRRNQIAHIPERCIQRGPLTESIVIDSACCKRDFAVFICLHLVHGNNNGTNHWLETYLTSSPPIFPSQKGSVVTKAAGEPTQAKNIKRERGKDTNDNQFTRLQEKSKHERCWEKKAEERQRSK